MTVSEPTDSDTGVTDSVGTQTPEATLRKRILAYAVDAVVLAGPIAAAVEGLDRPLRTRLTLFGVVTGVVGLLYHVVLEGAWGQTVGKRFLGVAVVRDGGEPCTYGAAAVRTAFRFVDVLPVAYLLGIASIAVSERNRRLGDAAANTLVVETDGDGR